MASFSSVNDHVRVDEVVRAWRGDERHAAAQDQFSSVASVAPREFVTLLSFFFLLLLLHNEKCIELGVSFLSHSLIFSVDSCKYEK